MASDIKQLVDDPDFLNLPESEQDSIIQAHGSKPQGINLGQVASQAGKALINPSPQEMTTGGLDPMQRMGQAALGNMYGQGRGQLQQQVPSDIKEGIGKGVTSGILPFAPPGLLSKGINQEIGNQAVGLGIDAGATAIAGGVEPLLEKTMGSAAKPLMGIGKAVKNATIDELPYLQRVRQSFLDTKTQAGKDFGNTIDTLTQKYPDRKVDLSGMIGELQQDMANEPKLASAVNKIPKLQEMLSKSGTGQYGVYGNPQTMNLVEAQDLKNAISSKLSQSKLSGSGVRPEDIPLFDALHNVNHGMLEAFPESEIPELAHAKKNYGQVQNDYKMIKNKIKSGSLAGNIQDKFGGDPEIQEAVKRLIGKSDAFEEMPGYRRAKEIPEVLKKSVGGGLVFYILHRLIGNAAEKLVSGRR